MLVGQVWSKTCQDCHSLEKIIPPNSSHWHPPFIQKNCVICHGSGEAGIKTVNLKGIKWFLQQNFRGGEAYILLSSRIKNYDLIFQSLSSPTFQKVLSFSSAKELPKSSEPQIEKVWFCGLEESPWIEAEICVKTNVPTSVNIDCQGVSGSTDENYYTDQIIPLAHVEKGKTYVCTVEAQDFSGTPAPPKRFSFVVDGIKKIPVNPPASQVEVNLYRSVLDEAILEIKSNGTFSWRLGGVASARQAGIIKNMPEKHPQMNPLCWSAIDACYQCHKKSMLGVSHPVNVPLTPNMAKRNDLPLKNGVMTCTTCHNPHASPYPYRLRKYGEALCLSCHNEQ